MCPQKPPVEFEPANPASLRPILTALSDAGANRFDPVRFRFIQALAHKARHQRPSVARALEHKALQALSAYLDDYAQWCEQAEGAGAGGDHRRGSGQAGALAELTQEILQHHRSAAASPEFLFEDELRRQEWEVVQSLAEPLPAASDAASTESQHGGPGQPGAMQYLRESLRRRHAQKRLSRVIHDGPENPGPLNSEALIIRSLAKMQELSPGYSNRFVAYMDTLLWLEQAGRTGRKRGKGD